jgi:hypothetical protein
MNNSREIVATITGAVLGGIVGYLFFTDGGRKVRRQLEPVLEELSREFVSIRRTVQEASGVATQGWTLLNDTLGDGGQPPARYANGETAPF